jgi:hypothetical protein
VNWALEFRAFKTAFDHARLSTDPFHRGVECFPEMREIAATPMAQLDPCEIGPEALDQVQRRGIGRQPLSLDPLSRAIGQERGDEVTAVHRGPIPEAQQGAGHLAPQGLQKRDDIGGLDALLLAMNIPLALRRNGADRREVITGPPFPEHGRVADWSIGPDDAGPGREPRCIDEEERLPLGLSPLVRPGQGSSRQRAIAASSR